MHIFKAVKCSISYVFQLVFTLIQADMSSYTINMNVEQNHTVYTWEWMQSNSRPTSSNKPTIVHPLLCIKIISKYYFYT